MDFMPLKLNSFSLTCSICALAAMIVQLVAMKCQKLHMVDLPILNLLFVFVRKDNYRHLSRFLKSSVSVSESILGQKFC